MHQAAMLLFALTAGLTLSGIVANLYRLLAPKPEGLPARVLYFAVMSLAGPSVLFNNATKSFRTKACSMAAYLFAVSLSGYWSFALGVIILSFLARA